LGKRSLLDEYFENNLPKRVHVSETLLYSVKENARRRKGESFWQSVRLLKAKGGLDHVGEGTFLHGTGGITRHTF